VGITLVTKSLGLSQTSISIEFLCALTMTVSEDSDSDLADEKVDLEEDEVFKFELIDWLLLHAELLLLEEDEEEELSVN
jgi:hypothetical protein